MRRFLLISGLAAMLTVSPLLANEKGPNRESRLGTGGPSVSGNLGTTPTFDRRFGVVFDGSCSATSSDSSNDGTAFDTYFVYPAELRDSARVNVFRDFLLSKARGWSF